MFRRELFSARLHSRREAVLQRIQATGSDRPHRRVVRKAQIAGATAALLGLCATGLVTGAGANAAPGPIGNGFNVTKPDIAFILKQIKIAEHHASAYDGNGLGIPANPNPTGDPEYCSSLVGPADDQIPDYLTSYGLRTTDGGCNNLTPAVLLNPNGSTVQTQSGVATNVLKYRVAQADLPFPRLTAPSFRPAEGVPADFLGSGNPAVPSSSYAQKKGVVYDTQPRLISNLIVDQTSTNPAAVFAAGNPVRSQAGATGVVPCTTDPDPNAIPPVVADPPGCIPSHHTLFIPNVTTDVGLSPPYNSLFTFFGQFFDHGVDQTVKSGGTVIVPLRDDDPLIAGPDHVLGNADDLPVNSRFMALTRAQNQPGPDGILGDDPLTPQDESADDIQNANNTDTPWVDQSQTYTSHSAHQVFLREYDLDANNHPLATGRLLGGLVPADDEPITSACTLSATCLNDGNATTGSISTWASVKKQAKNKLGLLLTDKDVTNVPMILSDPYGNFIPGPLRGLPQYVTKLSGLIEGNLASPVPVPADVVYFDTPFLTDIAHNADPSGGLTPDGNLTTSNDFVHQPAGTYDDELLNDHFVCGDGRCNENIALSTIHQVFHHEHDRLVGDIGGTIQGDPALKAGYEATNCAIGCATNNPALPITFTYGQRLFQAARFVTEMEYQHLVFEEFARKIQPAVRPFHVYSTDINSSIPAEFAHAVYRFGHSMLDDDVARTNIDGSDNSVALLTAFLNPPLFFDGGTAGTLTPEQAAGSIVMGSSDQVGNELDEFVTETLRNNLLGLPLDLATLNMTRARDAGIPPLNDVRRQIFARTNDGQLAPYTSWVDYGQNLKHPQSLINFVAAYGTHPSITSQSTIEGKRAAARAIVDPLPTDVPPADAADFMFGTGAWANVNGVTTTGLDSVDLWVGGLAEITNLFGGLLGSTFNYVFETSLENLQDGDRLYYLARTPGLNLRSQLEGNSFAEIIMRNTDGVNTLKADAFATADCKFQLGNLSGPAVAGSFLTGAGTVNDDPSTVDCDENRLLLQKPDGTIQYRQVNSVDPVGINGQSVYNGTNGDDRVWGGNDNDTFWGGPGNDTIEGNGGDDVALGGEGNDVITDLSGADVEKGGPGNDALDGGIGNDFFMGALGQDFINGGANDNESFAGPGNDYIIAGQGADAVFGDAGDDWIEGGSGQDLLQGDHGAPFFDDPGQTAPGNDIFVGQVGENDYDAEGGDDIMAQNAAIDRNAGAAGFDWAIHQYDTVGADDDLKINQQLVGLPIQLVVNRDRWQETEGDSGSAFNDLIKGDDFEGVVGPGGFQGCDALDPTGVARITGLNRLVTTFPSSLPDIVAASTMKQCPLKGFGTNAPNSGTVWAEGNILLGGGGNDVIEGRGNDDIIDGDHALVVHITVHAGPMDPLTGLATGPEIGRTDLMENKATSGTFGPGTAGMTLQQAIFARLVDPGQLVNARELVAPDGSPMGATADRALASDCPAPTSDAASTLIDGSRTVKVTPTTTNCDTSAYLRETLTPIAPGVFDPTTAYTITHNVDGSWTVADNTSVAAGPPFPKGDGIADTIWNIENLRFCVGNDAVTKDCNAFYDMPLDGAAPVGPVASIVTPAGTGDVIFGNTNVGTTAGPQAITVNNNGNAPLLVSSVTVTGTGASSFSATPVGCASIAAGGSCTINVNFAPASFGAKEATVTIFHNSGNVPGSTSTVTLTGTGLAPVAGITPASIPFGSVTNGTTSGGQTVSVSNTGNTALSLGVSLGGTNANQFNFTNSCGASVAAGATCTVVVRFAPTSTGGKSATLSLTHNNNNVAGTVSNVSLTGTGSAVVVSSGPVLSMPGNVAFGAQHVNQDKTISVTVLNQGPGTLTVSGVTTSGGVFSATRGTCTTTLAVGRSCKLSVTFHPTVIGQNSTGTLTVQSNAANNPTSATLTGSGRK